MKKRPKNKAEDLTKAVNNAVYLAFDAATKLRLESSEEIGQTAVVLRSIIGYLDEVEKLAEKDGMLHVAERIKSAAGNLQEVIEDWKHRGVDV